MIGMLFAKKCQWLSSYGRHVNWGTTHDVDGADSKRRDAWPYGSEYVYLRYLINVGKKSVCGWNVMNVFELGEFRIWFIY